MEFLNKIHLIGVVGRIMVRNINDREYAQFTLVTEYTYKRKEEIMIDMTWFNVNAAENVFQGKFDNIKRGSVVDVIGRLRIEKIICADGMKTTVNEVVASKVVLVSEERGCLKSESEDSVEDDQFTVASLSRHIDKEHRFNNLCEKKFLETVKSTLAERGGGMIHIDPDDPIYCVVEHKHGMDSGDIIGISLNEEGKVCFKVSTQYDLLVDEPLSTEAGYGVFIESWDYALMALLNYINDPYEPEPEEEEETVTEEK